MKCQAQVAIVHNLPRFCGQPAKPVRDSDGTVFIHLCDNCRAKLVKGEK